MESVTKKRIVQKKNKALNNNALDANPWAQLGTIQRPLDYESSALTS